MSKSCALCGQSAPDHTFDRLSGLDLCTICARGGAEQAAEARGFSLETTHWVTGSDDNHQHHLECTGLIEDAMPIRATFRRANFFQKLLGGFLRKVSTGDPLFDDNVWCTTSTPDLTNDLLKSDGMQSAVMDLVSESHGRVTIEDFGVRCHIAEPSLPDENRLQLETAVLLIHLDAWATVHALG